MLSTCFTKKKKKKKVISQQVLNAVGDKRIYGKDGPVLPGYNHNSGQRTQ